MDLATAEPKVIISSQVSAAVRDALAERAVAADRTLSAEVRRVLTAAVEAQPEEEA
jgi:hypothetical protein